MTCKVQILAPIWVDDEKKTKSSGEVFLPDALAEEHDKAGRVLILERDGVEDQWPGCCAHHDCGKAED